MLRVLLSLGASIVAWLTTALLCLFADFWIRGNRYDGSAGMYGFLYGLIAGPVVGIATAVGTWIWQKRRQARLERSSS
jgi:hypothetical protein